MIEKPIVIDIWSAAYNAIKPYLHPVREIDGKMLYKSSLDRFYYLADNGIIL